MPESFLFKALFTIFYFLGAIYKRQKWAFNRNAVRIETKNVLKLADFSLHSLLHEPLARNTVLKRPWFESDHAVYSKIGKGRA